MWLKGFARFTLPSGSHRVDPGGSFPFRIALERRGHLRCFGGALQQQAEVRHQMARMTVSPFKKGSLELAEEWTKLAQESREAEAKAAATA